MKWSAALSLMLLMMFALPAHAQRETAPAEAEPVRTNPLLFPEPIDVDWPAHSGEKIGLDEGQSRSPQPARQFTEGSWTVHGFGSAVVGDDDKGNLYGGTIGVGYFFADGWSINGELLGGYVNSTTDDDGGAAAFDLMFRYHFLRGKGWSIYNDFGAGVQLANTKYPSDSHFVFRLELGVGATVQLVDNVNLMGGVRYIHSSNAYITPINDGQDAAMVYLGLMLTY